MALNRNSVNSTNFAPGSEFSVEDRVVDITTLRPHPLNSYEMDAASIDALADNIRQVGLIQPIYLREVEDGGLQILSGHRRVRALRHLAKNDETFRHVPARVATGLSDADALFILHSANIFRPISKEERLKQTEQLKQEIADLRADHPEWKNVRTDEIIAGMLDMTTSTYKRQTKIAKNLIPELHEMYEHGEMGPTVALDLAKLPEEDQRGFLSEVQRREPKTKQEVAAVYSDYNVSVGQLLEELEGQLRKAESTLFRVRDACRQKSQPTYIDLDAMKRMRDHLDELIGTANKG
jgi:ParB family chromosome partitioning protein